MEYPGTHFSTFLNLCKYPAVIFDTFVSCRLCRLAKEKGKGLEKLEAKFVVCISKKESSIEPAGL
jgi:hypothetical protein